MILIFDIIGTVTASVERSAVSEKDLAAGNLGNIPAIKQNTLLYSDNMHGIKLMRRVRNLASHLNILAHLIMNDNIVFVGFDIDKRFDIQFDIAVLRFEKKGLTPASCFASMLASNFGITFSSSSK